jgi:hypothetical protein
VESRVERDSGSSSGDDSQICRDPAGMVRCQDRHASIARNMGRKPVRHALRHARKFRESDALDRLLALNFKGNIVWKLAGRFLKTLVEGGHVRGEYTKGS